MRIGSILSVALALNLALAQTADARLRHHWSRVLEASGSTVLQEFDVAGNGDLVVVAGTVDSVSFGGGKVGSGLVVARLASGGAHIWSRRLLVSGPATPYDVAATPDGGAIVIGAFGASANFGGGVLTPAGLDVFLVRLDPGGATVWQKQFGGAQNQMGYSVALAGNGDIVITGANFATIDFGGGIIRSNGTGDVFLARLRPDGGHVWSRGFGFAGIQEGNVVACGPGGQVAIVCRQEGQADFGGGMLTGEINRGMAIAVFDSLGGHAWSRQLYNPPPFLATLGLAFDPDGNLVYGGFTSDAFDVGGVLLQPPVTASRNGFVVSYDPAGGHRWSHLLVDSLHSAVDGLDVDASGNTFLVARNDVVVQIGNEMLSGDAFIIAGFDPAGNVISADGFGVSRRGGAAIGIDDAGNIHLAGDVRDAIDLGGGTLLPANEIDVFLARLSLWQPPAVAIHGFAARLHGAAVEVSWTVESSEALGDYTLRRRTDASPSVRVVDFGPAAAGASSFIDRTTQPGRAYTYELGVANSWGDEVFSPAVTVSVPVFTTALRQNAPNPFNPSTRIAYSLDRAATVAIAIYDVTGTRVARLDQGTRAAGDYEATWDGRNGAGATLPAGVYFYRLEGLGGTGPRKMLLLK